MPKIIDYDAVLQTLLGQGLKSLYYNSGSFGFPPRVVTHTIGWLGPADSTIRPEARPFTRQIAEPYPKNLSELALRVWRELLPGPLWVLPRSHWAYELDFGSRSWMPPALREIGIDPAALEPLTTGNAIEFLSDETHEFGSFLTSLLDNLSGSSDFQIAWPGRPVVCIVHHHQQLWWTTADPSIHAPIAELV